MQDFFENYSKLAQEAANKEKAEIEERVKRIEAATAHVLEFISDKCPADEVGAVLHLAACKYVACHFWRFVDKSSMEEIGSVYTYLDTLSKNYKLLLDQQIIEAAKNERSS